MQLNKSVWKVILCLFIGGGLAACSDDDDKEATSLFIGHYLCNNDNGNKGIEGTEYATTTFSKIQLSEVIKSDAQTVTATETYTYHSGRLQSYDALQNFTAIEPVEMESRATVTYGDHQAVVSDDSGNVSTYTLNDKGYAVSCTRKEGSNNRNYIFSYLTNSEGKCYLANITETMEDGTVYASINIDYKRYRALRVTQKVDTYQQAYTATTPSGNEIMNISEIPCLFFAELYPLSLHQTALYGKLLGEPLDVLISQIIPDGNSENNETVSYTYTTDGRGIVTSCQAVTNSYGTNYVRTVNYVIK